MQTAVLTEIQGSRAVLRFAGEAFPAVLGAGGVRADKSEGDRATPVGLLPIRRVLFRADRGPAPRTVLPREAIAPEDGWCDDPSQPEYNRAVTLPFAFGHERLWREERVYDLIGVLGWNDAPVVPGRGSAIFLHPTMPDERPTDSCIAMDPAILRRLLERGLNAIEVPAP